MPWVQVVVVVVDDDLDNIAVVDHEGVDLAVDCGIGRKVLTNGVGGIQGRNILRDVRLVVDGEASNAVDLSGESVDNNLLVHWLEQGLLVEGNERDIVHKVELM